MEFVLCGIGAAKSEDHQFAGKLQIPTLSRNKSVAVNVRDFTRSEEFCLLRVHDNR